METLKEADRPFALNWLEEIEKPLRGMLDCWTERACG